MRAGLAQHLAALDLFLLRAPEQGADVVAGLALVEELAEHLDAGAGGLLRRPDADDLDLVTGVDDALLDLAGHDRAPTGDREHVLDRHQERLVEVTRRLGHEAVDRLHQLEDPGRRVRVALERLERRDPDDRGVVAGELVLVEQLADLELDELEELLVVDLSTLLSATTIDGTPTWRASSTCSRVWGIGPSVAATTRIAPSTWAAPVIMFLM